MNGALVAGFKARGSGRISNSKDSWKSTDHRRQTTDDNTHNSPFTTQHLGISATIGNLDEAMEVLLAPSNSPEGREPSSHIPFNEASPDVLSTPQSEGCVEVVPTSRDRKGAGVIVHAEMKKKMKLNLSFLMKLKNIHGPVILGISSLIRSLPILNESKTTLIFINTRGMSEIWYQTAFTSCSRSGRRHCIASWKH